MKKIFLCLILSLIPALCPAVMEIVVQPQEENYVYDYQLYADEISALKPVSLAGILESITDINVATKGFAAVLNDISINAGSFEQAAILLDGIKVNDPQTGHFNLDVPLPSINIGRLTIVKNAGSSTGAGGFTGLINIETPEYDRDILKGIFEYGTYNTVYSGLLYMGKFTDLTVDFSAEAGSSDGYHFDTDFYKNTAFIKLGYTGAYTVSLGFDEKGYGAYDFYTPGANRASWEYTVSKYAAISFFKGYPFNLSFYYRGHYDDFVLIRTNPSYYRNKHDSSIYGWDISYKWEFDAKDSASIRSHLCLEEIQSARLGNHYRLRDEKMINGYFNFFEPFTLNLNADISKYDKYPGYDFLPSIAGAYKITKELKLTAGYSYSVRYPDFTELYYSDPLNQGNADLKPEKCSEYNAGAQAEISGAVASFSGFYRQSFDLIDWGKENISDAKWRIKNIGKVNSAGMTAGVDVPLDFIRLGVSYTYLDSYRSEAFISKYGLTYLRNKLAVSAGFELFEAKARIGYIYKNYINREEAYNGLDITLSREILKGVELSLKSENTLNWYFEETIGIPAAGRIISARIEAQI